MAERWKGFSSPSKEITIPMSSRVSSFWKVPTAMHVSVNSKGLSSAPSSQPLLNQYSIPQVNAVSSSIKAKPRGNGNKYVLCWSEQQVPGNLARRAIKGGLLCLESTPGGRCLHGTHQRPSSQGNWLWEGPGEHCSWFSSLGKALGIAAMTGVGKGHRSPPTSE